MNDSYEIGQRIKSLRLKKNLSQKRFGEKIGVSLKSISAYETGRVMPPFHVLNAISLVFGVSVFKLENAKHEYLKHQLNVLKDSLSELENLLSETLSF